MMTTFKKLSEAKRVAKEEAVTFRKTVCVLRRDGNTDVYAPGGRHHVEAGWITYGNHVDIYDTPCIIGE